MAKLKTIDINCDVGEGIGNEAELMPLISSCNIACGGHAGDRESMTKVIRLAKENRVKIGAHPSYPDKINFGRTSMTVSDAALCETLELQVHELHKIANDEGLKLHHIKAHGALYNDIAKNEGLSEVFLEAARPFRKDMFLYVPYDSVIARMAVRNKFRILYEAFADRNYRKDLSLVPRDNDKAIIKDRDEVLKHVLYMVEQQKVRTVEGYFSKILADTFCIHGDNVLAFEILSYLTRRLPDHNIHIKK